MIIKNFINLFNIFSVLLFIVYIYLVNFFFTTTNIRKKFFLFLINLFCITGIGFYYNLDGLVMLFMMSELSIILIFITLFSQLYSYCVHNKHNNFSYIIFFVLIILNFSHYDITILGYKNFYSFYNIILNDFYYFYNCYFEKQILLTILTIFIITTYSVFFILLYYLLKQKDHSEKQKKKTIFLLRKQNILHQANYNTKIRIFKNNN